VSNGLTTKVLALMKIHGITQEEAEKMLQEIQAEQQTATAATIDFFGVNNNAGSGGDG
jgi:hypothetical protein